MAFWAAGFWAEGLWADGFWAASDTPPADITDILLTSNTVSVAGGMNAVVGVLSAVGGTGAVTFTLVAGAGDTNNADFSISGNVLRCDDPENLGVGTHSVRIQAADGTSTYAEPVSIRVVEPKGGVYGFTNFFTNFSLRF